MTYDRFTASNAAVFVDHQTGLANGVQTQSPPEFINNVKALVTIAQIYELPSIITTSAADGLIGPIMPVVAEGLPDATIVHSGCTVARESERGSGHGAEGRGCGQRGRACERLHGGGRFGVRHRDDSGQLSFPGGFIH